MIILNYFERHNQTTGQMLLDILESLVSKCRGQESKKLWLRLDPKNTALRWAIVTTRRKHYVPCQNSLWHLDGHHFLIHWGFVIHGCIDWYSRRVIFLEYNNNNLSQTVLNLFIDAIQRNGWWWPYKIHVDFGVENVSTCDTMDEKRGEGRSSFIAGPSARNQRIGRLWRNVFRCVIYMF